MEMEQSRATPSQGNSTSLKLADDRYHHEPGLVICSFPLHALLTKLLD